MNGKERAKFLEAFDPWKLKPNYGGKIKYPGSFPLNNPILKPRRKRKN